MDDGYPDESELQKIREWDYKDFPALMEYVRSLWWWSGRQITVKDNNLWFLSTGGWSGNEDIIGALKENAMFWGLCWQSSKRGGHYVFRVEALKDKEDEN